MGLSNYRSVILSTGQPVDLSPGMIIRWIRGGGRGEGGVPYTLLEPTKVINYYF